jgi:hypothetical protein
MAALSSRNGSTYNVPVQNSSNILQVHGSIVILQHQALEWLALRSINSFQFKCNTTFSTTNTLILDNKHDNIMVLHVARGDTCSSKEANHHAMHLQKAIGCSFFLLVTSYQTK